MNNIEALASLENAIGVIQGVADMLDNPAAEVIFCSIREIEHIIIPVVKQMVFEEIRQEVQGDGHE